MKRSEINKALKELEAMCEKYSCYLPPFCHFSPEEWQQCIFKKILIYILIVVMCLFICSVSPFNNEEQVGEYLRGTRVVYYSKPRAEYVTNRGPLDEDAIRKCFRDICKASSGCMLEIAQREVGTIYGDYERGKRYVQLARETVAEYWKP